MQNIHVKQKTQVLTPYMIRAARTKLRMNQTELARHMKARGFTNWYQQTVQRTEAGEREIRLNEGEALAQILHLDSPDLQRLTNDLLELLTLRSELDDLLNRIDKALGRQS